MIKENQKFLNKLQIIIDMLIVAIAFLIAYYIRFFILDGSVSMGLKQSFIPVILSIPVYFILYNIFDLYTPKRTKTIHKEIEQIIKANALGALVLILGLFLFKFINFSRWVLVFFIILNTIGIISSRIILRYTLRKYRREGFNQKHCIIIGINDTSLDLISKIKNNPQWGYNIVGFIDEKRKEDFCGFHVIGKFKNIDEILSKKHIDIVFITINEADLKDIGNIINKCEKAGVKTNIVPYYYKYVPAKPYMDDLNGLPIIDTRHVPLENFVSNISKRLLDIVFSLFAIIITSPIMILSVIMIKLTSPGHIIYKQERVGYGRKNFYMYKFRSMKIQTEQEEKIQWTTQNDPRKTKWGAFMRKTSIDELPQFFNVLKGDMSIVGPRPERPFFVDKFKDEIPRYMIKHQVRPGITGWAQINGYRGDTSIEKRIECDLEYIENWTFLFDIKIIFLTVFKGFVNKNAY
ncbi:undecaprenyl-phosphate glucose phosphotransferase [Romboutsia maritimum]|uniref:Undecaprenyl-phosphate glucose phosphotransferase n=1 Tax=Romboutsia maritimum TaxID=2020948 RepID=A0A371IS19_9FIRM|nr:undecaprenyl-phosphate glucose phosphotransferase [Romboutsia maritimum]RDY23263.1 undecaprenyl-phosphate glucose phosphotransferase [Romboutsia maritimum]